MAVVVLAMSGGVDSSVAAQLLQADGHEVVGVFLRHGVDGARESCSTPGPHGLPVVSDLQHKQGCCTAADAEDARSVAQQLEIPFYALNLQEDFERIVDYFVGEYSLGRTPNPCVMCNHQIKFGKLFSFATSLGADYVATGHYARVMSALDGQMRLRRGRDASKDQSYALFGVRRALLDRMLLPIGNHKKAEIRECARQFGLRVAEKRDSQEICFVSPGAHAQFVATQRGTETSGDIITTAGQVVGRHSGIEQFTIGQRKGLGVALGEPRFVVRIEAESRQVVIGKRPELARRTLTARGANWLVDVPRAARRCLAQIRYNSQAVTATMAPLEGDRFAVEFDEACFGVAPGQAVVCYDRDQVLGGGWIE